MDVSLRILFAGYLREGATSLQRMVALQEIGHFITPIDFLHGRLKAKEQKLIWRAVEKLFRPIDRVKVNTQLIKMVKEREFDIVWIEKGLTVWPGTLKKIKPQCIIAGFSRDDMNNPANQSKNFLRGLCLYDIYFTTKSYGVSELEALGCPRAEFIANAYDKHTHHPMPVTAEDRERLGGPVGFIGDAERERAESIAWLAENGIPVKVWGDPWGRWKKITNGKFQVAGPSYYGKKYAKIICSFDINLGFLRKANRDLQTGRSVEIPACGGFMLAERTDEHLELFEEGKEAEFFGSNEELLDKVKYYLSHDDKRKMIARAGRERCLRSGYSNHDRLKKAIDKIMNLRKL